ncbi:hypothetical protein L2E82_33738 [Cichorium intybus]|uniref:Uncharacterized protein n=1 Tax=Cichorium intybus TaxID=13427 RepID=A0ACB9BL11_CICIN|nr:hypothetical protein L2E82_33738 [Cichorium intybus]
MIKASIVVSLFSSGLPPGPTVSTSQAEQPSTTTSMEDNPPLTALHPALTTSKKGQINRSYDSEKHMLNSTEMRRRGKTVAIFLADPLAEEVGEIEAEAGCCCRFSEEAGNKSEKEKEQQKGQRHMFFFSVSVVLVLTESDHNQIM